MDTYPALEDSFFGRKEIVSCLEKRFNAFLMDYRQNVGLIGKPLIGKSSILSHFLRKSSAQKVICILIRVDEVDSFPIFAQKWMGSILCAYQRFKGKCHFSDYQELANVARRELPKLSRKMRQIRRLIDHRKYEDAYQDLINLLQILHEETKVKILLALDEFDRLSCLSIKDPFSKLGRAIMLQKDIMYVVSSSNASRAQDIFREKLSLLFSNFEVIQVGHFSFDESREWIDQRLGDYPIDHAWKRFLINLTNGHPYYLDVIISRLQNALENRQYSKSISELFAQVLTEELFLDHGVLNQHFSADMLSIAKNRSALPNGDVLLSIAKGNKKLQSIAGFLSRPQVEIKKILQKLISEDFIERHGLIYDIVDSLFKFWLREVYFRKRSIFGFDYQMQQREFRESLQRYFEHVCMEDQKDLTLRIEQLFKMFGNDTIAINSDVVKCPRFSEVQSKPTNGRMFPVVAKSYAANWLCQVVRDRLKEDDVQLFLADAAKLKTKMQKKVMIALRGVELNAKLLAKESKIELWDLRNLNVLLELYNQPKVIL